MGLVSSAPGQGLPRTTWLVMSLAAAGLAIAAIVALTSVLTVRSVPAAVLTQALTWMNSASAAGLAVGAVLVGIAVDAYGSPAGFLCAAASAGVIVLAAAAGQRSLGADG